MPDWPVLLLTIALSLDGLGAGLSYGIRGTRLPPAAYLVIALLTGVLMSASIAAGQSIRTSTDAAVASTLGRLLLIAVGLWEVYQGWHQYLRRARTPSLATWRLRPLGIVVQILRDPEAADLDRSGRIDAGESALLGLALGLDAFGAGFAAGMLAFPAHVVVTVSLGCAAFVAAGVTIGRASTRACLPGQASVLPGLLLILLAAFHRT
ncbi:MAG: sporulation membrane protein YtaF [Bacillota bacterium]